MGSGFLVQLIWKTSNDRLSLMMLPPLGGQLPTAIIHKGAIEISCDLFFKQNTDSKSCKPLPLVLNQVAAVFLLIDINLDLAESDVTL